jgi:hypothetical protein
VNQCKPFPSQEVPQSATSSLSNCILLNDCSHIKNLVIPFIIRRKILIMWVSRGGGAWYQQYDISFMYQP